MDDRTPDPQPFGALTPPPRTPPTAIATSAPLPPPRRSAVPSVAFGERLAALARTALDTLDQVGDRIAAAAGLR